MFITMRKFFAIIAFLTSLCFAKAQDTCVVALRIDNKTAPFEIKTDKNGQSSGFLAKGMNGDIYLYTNRPFIKIVNESGSEMRNKNTGEFRVITFENGSATTFDYSNKTDDHKWAFIEKKVKNFQNQIYFGKDIHETTFSFMLENNPNYRRVFKTRSVFGEFDGLKNIDITVRTPEGVDSTYTFGDSERVDSLVLTSGSVIKKISATRGRNGLLNAITVNGNKLNALYSYRNTNGTFEEDNYTVRNATLATTDTTLSVQFPCDLIVEYSYLEGDNNAQVDHRRIYIETRDSLEEGSNTWIYILLVLLLVGGVGYYYYRRYQLKKAGIIPETDAEKVVRLQKEVATHTATIKELQQTESNLLADKDSLQKEVSKLNTDLSKSRQETKDKADESEGFRTALTKLQEHTDDLQETLDKANAQIKVFESNHEHVENLALHQQLNDLHQEMDNQMRADAEKLRATIAQKDEERAKAVAQKQQELIAAQEKNEAELKAALNMQVDELNASLMKKQQELNEALAKKQQELEDTKLQLAREKNDALAKLEGDSNESYNKMKRDLNAKIAMLTQARQADLESHEEAIKNLQAQADQIIAQTQANAADEIAEYGDVVTHDADEVFGDKELNIAVETIKLMQNDIADMIFTDPPYNVNYGATMKDALRYHSSPNHDRRIMNDNLGDNFGQFLTDSLTNMLMYCCGAAYVCMSSSELHTLYNSFIEAGGKWSTFIIWAKNTFTLGRADYQRQYEPILYGWVKEKDHYWCGDRNQSDVWEYNKPVRNDLHPTMKPVELVMRAIQNSSKLGGVVLDGFGGSGSTLIACEKLGRSARLVELDPKYCDVIIKRWEEMTGKKAVLWQEPESA